MVTVENFLDIEGNSYTKKLLLETIERLSSNDLESVELTFNVYSITIFYKKNEILISDDICPDENPAVIVPLDKFHEQVRNFEIIE